MVNLLLRTWPGYSVSQPYQSPDWALVPAKPAQGLNTHYYYYCYQWSPPQHHPEEGKSSSHFLLRSCKSDEFRNILLSTATRSSWQQRYDFPTALCSSMTSVEGWGWGHQIQMGLLRRGLRIILTWWCLGKDAVRSLHKHFSNSFW